jgi:TRAP-type C4-dicarboxylate transport system permease small subunit
MSGDRSSGPEMTSRARLIGLARAVIRYWALLGGLILVLLVLMTAGSAVSNLLFRKPFPGDFELVKHGVAIAAFAFLPYAQLTYANVTVDIFTERMSDRAKSVMSLFASVVAAALAVLLFRQMWDGMLDYIKYPVHMVSIPVALWTAFPPALVSLALLLVASLITAGESFQGVKANALKVQD